MHRKLDNVRKSQPKLLVEGTEVSAIGQSGYGARLDEGRVRGREGGHGIRRREDVDRLVDARELLRAQTRPSSDGVLFSSFGKLSSNVLQ